MRTETGKEPIYFTEDNSVDAVVSRMAGMNDQRLKDVITSAVKHLHAFVKETEPTHAEWMTALQFLTHTGQTCSEWRQEWILLSDVLGVSMLVDAINNRKPSGATETTVLGPFHVPGAPRYPNGANICHEGKGEPLLVSGRVIDAAGKPVAGAQLDVWQANDEGFYDVQQKGIQPDYNLRGIFTTDRDGRYWFRTIKPRFYPIPNDGPVGQLLERLGRHPYRPAHIHFIVTAPGFQSVTTHIFAQDSKYLDSDPVFGVKESLIAYLTKINDQHKADELGFPNPYHAVNWDFVLTCG